MKVVIFCGGFGVRMGEETRRIPKPMIEIGGRPILWHIMRYYSMWGHDEFILCLGYKGEVVKQFFLSYNGALLNDFVLDRDATGTRLEMLSRDLDKWRITFVDTGLNATIGERLKAVEPHLGDDDTFLATYGDGLTDAPLTKLIDAFHESGKTAQFLSVRPQFNAHMVTAEADGTVLTVDDMSTSAIRINGGFMVLKREILDLIEPGRRARRGDVREADRGARAGRVSVRGLLPGDGHDQGPPEPGEPERVRRGALAALPGRRGRRAVGRPC